MKFVRGEHGEYTFDGEKPLGSGGNGEVWLAQGASGAVAIKLLKNRGRIPKDAGSRFANEIAALKKLGNMDGIVPLLDHGTCNDGAQWFAMPVATTLPAKLGTSPAASDVLDAMAGIAAALQSVHEAGLAHRDIKPDNLYWFNQRWCLGDFGLVELPDAPSITVSYRKLGPAYYIAPEMLNEAPASPGKSADIYSLGKTIWVVITGQNFPLPGVHDPTYPAAAMSTYREDSRMTMLDELVRRMTLLNPTDRPGAKLVSQELEILAKERTAVHGPKDSTGAFRKLKAALAPHQSEAAAREQTKQKARSMLDALRREVDAIAAEISVQTGLGRQNWIPMPRHWEFHASMRSSQRSIEQHSQGVSFRAGDDLRSWTFSVGYRAELLSDGKLLVFAGYGFDQHVGEHLVRASGGPRGWEERGEAEAGMPSAHELIATLKEGLRENMPAMVEEFARLVAGLSKR